MPITQKLRNGLKSVLEPGAARELEAILNSVPVVTVPAAPSAAAEKPVEIVATTDVEKAETSIQ